MHILNDKNMMWIKWSSIQENRFNSENTEQIKYMYVYEGPKYLEPL